MKFDALICGAGLTGCVIAERLASAGKKVLIVERRDYIGGNCADMYRPNGVLVHRHGPHWFRCNSDRIVEYLSRFTEWTPCEYRCRSSVDGELYEWPLNQNSLQKWVSKGYPNILLGSNAPSAMKKNAHNEWLFSMNPSMFGAFIEPYSKKQWGCELTELDSDLAKRAKFKCSTDDRFFDHKFQALPKDGYSAMFERMVNHENISISLNHSGRKISEIASKFDGTRIIWTGSIDEFFDYKLGKLEYRSTRIEFEDHPKDQFQECMQINYPSQSIPFTRIVEYKQATQQRISGQTTISKEYPEAWEEGKERMYPIPKASARKLYEDYQALAKTRPDVTFAGRLGTFRYLDMDQAVGAALTLADKLI